MLPNRKCKMLHASSYKCEAMLWEFDSTKCQIGGWSVAKWFTNYK